VIVADISLCTPLGLTTQATVHACAARLTRAMVVDDAPRAPTASRLGLLSPELHREDRMLGLLVRAATGLRLPPALARPLPSFLALPEPAVGLSFVRGRWLTDLRRVLGDVDLELRHDRCHEDGRAGWFHALAAAQALMTAHGGPPAVLVGAADSLVDPTSLRVLQEDERLLGDRNPDGIIPGEAAGWVLLVRPELARHPELSARAEIVALTTARDDAPMDDRVPLSAAALTRVFRALRAAPALTGRRVDRVYSAQPETAFWAAEFSAAYLRNASMMPEPLDHLTLMNTLGDVGAAAGACLLALAVASFDPPPWMGLSPLHRVLLYGSSDRGDCAACLVTAPPEPLR
jgi:3-oxoacyl-[acyl-carrier-protein] synthase I